MKRCDRCDLDYPDDVGHVHGQDTPEDNELSITRVLPAEIPEFINIKLTITDDSE